MTAMAAGATSSAAGLDPLAVLAVLACLGALVAGYVVLFPPHPKIAINRVAPTTEKTSRLTGITARATQLVEQLLGQLRGAPALVQALEAAGLRMRPAEFVILVAAPTVVLAGFVLVLAGPLLALLVALLAVFGARVVLTQLAARRRAAFADQLDDSLQLMASGLRAGHSLLRAIDALSSEAEAPSSEEFARIINETRLGRDVGNALEAAAARMQSEDFLWVAQAIAVHREVGGNLAEVLDQVGETIRERNQIRRQIKSLSAEGRISALVLMIMPFGIGGFLALVSPSYVGRLFNHPIGIVLLIVAVLLLIAGGLWLRKVISFKF
jgi:tight adherence protein B